MLPSPRSALLLLGFISTAAAAFVTGQLARTHGTGIGRSCVRMGKKDKKSSFEAYQISGESVSELFPLPDERDAIHVHKKHMPKGCSPSKAPPGSFDSFMPSVDLQYPGARLVHLDPPVLCIDNFFTDEECDAYQAIRDSEDDAHCLEQSATFSSSSMSTRTSTTWFLRYQAVPAFLAKASALTGMPVSHFEEPQLVRYQQGQCFSWHYDAVPATQLKRGGQRRATLLVYLNDVPKGGHTAFRDLRQGGTDDNGSPLRLTVEPKRGRALLFFPSFADGTPDWRTLHAGEPGPHEKWIGQLWLHHEPYPPNVPDGTSHEAAEPLVREFATTHGLRLAPP